MIPLHLKLSGFLSYHDPVDLDFTSFELACISGENGAGKSSLLDAITWVLFGQARKRDEAIINSTSSAAEVVLTFIYEGLTYRIQRTLPRGKSTLLEFQILDPKGNGGDEKQWRPLSERTTRETQARIEETLHLDYDTFVNASFFLQGKADQFTQQKASDRKRILASILGLDAWEDYKNRTADRRKLVEHELDSVDGRIREINDELMEEDQRKQHLTDLDAQLTGLKTNRKAQESALEAMKQAAASFTERRKLAEALHAHVQRAESNRNSLQKQYDERESERKTFGDLLSRAADVEAAFKTWQSAKESLEKWDTTAVTFREYEKKRQPYLDEINTEKARLVQEQSSLNEQLEAVEKQRGESHLLKKEIDETRKHLSQVEEKIAQRDELKSELDSKREQSAALKAESDTLKIQMEEHKSRIEQISKIEGASCPLCGQPLTAAHRKSTLAQLSQEGKEMGDRWRKNKSDIERMQKEIKKTGAEVDNFSDADRELITTSNALSRLNERLDSMEKAEADWGANGAKRLKEVNKAIEKDNFAPTARKALTALDKELKKLGYDAAAHDDARQAELAGRSAEQDYQSLEKARATLKPLEREIASIQEQMATLDADIEKQKKEYLSAQEAIDQTKAPDIDTSERELYSLQEQENRLNQDVGAARQKVNVLDDLRARKKRFECDREELAAQIGNFKTLERAFGKDGVPALLIEQALPEIEAKANEILDRLSNGAMSVRFITQRGYKDSKRDDLKETLDIQISDGAGLRDYEMFSGGEVFRVNFAVRLALSEILARRTGARLQTLVIDEGFGSQDAQGRQRLIESINSVRRDFAKILVITHLEELKDVFPNRIEVEKTPQGSTLQVL
jgi:DNA repair protein SbcC/Rad50